MQVACSTRTDAQVVKHDKAYSLFVLPIHLKRRYQFQDWINLTQRFIAGHLKHGNHVSSLTTNKFFFTSRESKFFKQQAVASMYLLLRYGLMQNVNMSDNLYLQNSACDATSFSRLHPYNKWAVTAQTV